MGVQLIVVGALSLALAFTASALTASQGPGAAPIAPMPQGTQVQDDSQGTGGQQALPLNPAMPILETKDSEDSGEQVGETEQEPQEAQVDKEDGGDSGSEGDKPMPAKALLPSLPAMATGSERVGPEVSASGTASGTPGAAARAGNPPGMAIAEGRRSAVADAVQQLLKVADRNGGIGDQVRTIAQEQSQNRDLLEQNLQKIQGRSGVLKFLIGPDYGGISEAQGLLERDREQIQSLERIKSNLTDEADKQLVGDQIATLQQADTSIGDAIASAQKGFSLFGWAFRLFAR